MKFAFRVVGRPAPEGSHEVGANGYVMHSSKYLENWRTEVNRAARKGYLATDLTGRDMPLFKYPDPVQVAITHIVGDDQCRAEGSIQPTGSPDLDKLARATIDGLGEARVFGNDSQVVILTTRKRRPLRPDERPGAAIHITDEIDTPVGEIRNMGSFTPTGRYRVALEEIVIDSDGDRTWETVVEASDTPERIAAVWLPAMSTALGTAPAPVTAPSAAEPDKPRATRARKAAAAAASDPVAVQQPAPVTEPNGAAPTPQAPAEPAVRVNPFAR